MSDIDYALAYDFIDPAEGIARQLRFRRNPAPRGHTGIFGGTGQLVAVIAHASHPNNGHTMPISRPNVDFDQVETVLDGWQSWAQSGPYTADLAVIRTHIRDAGLT